MTKFTGKHLCQSLFFNKVAGRPRYFPEFCEISKNTISRNTSWRLFHYICFSFFIIIHSFVCQLSLHYYWYCYNKKQSSAGVLKKKGFWQIFPNSPENTCAKDLFLMKLQIYRVNKFSKKRVRLRYFLVNSAKFLITHFYFLKEPFERLLPREHSFCLLSHHDLLFFQKQNFPTEYFLGLIYRLGTRVSSISQTLSQTLIFNPVEHLRRSFFTKIA